MFHGRFAEGALYDESFYAKDLAAFVNGTYHEVNRLPSNSLMSFLSLWSAR